MKTGFTLSETFREIFRRFGLSRLLAGSLLTLSAVLGVANSAIAAQRVVFTYGPIGRSISVSDLKTLAETGEATRQIRWYLNLANLDQEQFQKILTQEVTISQRLIDKVSYSLPGQYLLFQVGQTVHTSSRKATIQALRASLLLSASQDNRVSLLEVLENYPTPEMYIDGVSLQKFVGEVGDLIEEIEPAIAVAEEFLENLVCDCQAPAATSEPSP